MTFSRSGVVRGRVVTPNGSGLMGVRVSSSSPLDPLGGFTLTQDDGWFDLMVNGGGAVTLHFGRSPFNPQTRTIFVPWNEVNNLFSRAPFFRRPSFFSLKHLLLWQYKITIRPVSRSLSSMATRAGKSFIYFVKSIWLMGR